LGAEVVVCPIVREADGLAMSSRNAYLRPEERQAATVLHKALCAARREIEAGERDALRLLGVMRGVLDAERLAAVDYVEIVDAESFEGVTRLRRACLAVMAVFLGKTRLIDNMLIEEQEGACVVSV
jgi:pantoate--beta-alanine ligase